MYRDLIYSSKRHRGLLYYSSIFIISGAICSCIDVIFWGGSIDYIELFHWFIFDLKDFYITISSVLMVLYVMFFIRDYIKLNKKERKQ